MILRAFAVWAALMAVAIANGALRETVLVSRLGSGGAHLISTLLLCVAIVAVTSASIRWIGPESRMDAVLIGALWLVLVLTFEFGFGHFIARKSWSQLLADYDVLGGRVWLAVPVLTACAPYLAARFRGLF